MRSEDFGGGARARAMFSGLDDIDALDGGASGLQCANGVYETMIGDLVTVVETPLFVRQAAMVWDEPEREAFISFIAGDPEAGDVIPETGGVRKVRWTRSGSGKRGGVRVIYFFSDEGRPIYLLMVYAKARKEDLDPNEKRAVRKLTAILKARPA